ncbi:MAG: hypothetical protein LC792_21100, partial [Actinobacteria bacterium]|nr:hypothetical protein [Actinomycetota bacterium]
TSARLTGASATATEGSGATHTYSWSAGGYHPPDSEDGVVGKDANGAMTFHGDDGLAYAFDGGGRLSSATAATDDGAAASVSYAWTGSPPRLRTMTDPVSGRAINLAYGGDAACPTAPPAGFSVAPAGLLCSATYWDSSVTRYWYVGTQLGRIEDPGGAVTDFAYSGGRLSALRTPALADAVAATAVTHVPDDDTTRTLVTYDASGRVASLTLPVPNAGSTPPAARPAHSYEYPSASETRVHVAGLGEPNGFARKVAFDSAGRALADTDATGRVASAEWDPGDRQLSSTDPAGRKATTLYDWAARPTDAYGPAPASCFGADRRPNASCATPMPHTATAYDGGMKGLAAAYWANASLSGAPTAHDTGVGDASGALVHDWGSGAPAGLPADLWSARFSGEITLAATGDYRFALNADNGVRLWVDDALVAERWDNLAYGWVQSQPFTNTTAGSHHRIRVDFFEWGGLANLELDWIPPGGTQALVPGADLAPRYGLGTRTTTDDATPGSPPQVTATSYATPANGLPSAVTVDPDGAALATTTAYEAPGAGLLRRTSRTLAAGNATTYAYYANTEARANPCNTAVSANQAGMLKTTTAPDPDGGGPQAARVQESVYDGAGRVVASRVNAESWSCAAYDARGRITSRSVPANGTEAARSVSYDYSVGGNPLITAVSDPAGTITTTVDLLGRVVSYSDAAAKTTSSTYDQPGRVTDTSGPAGAQHYDYDPAGRLSAQKLDGASVAVPSYDGAGELASVSYPSGVGSGGNGTALSTIGRDPAGRTTSLAWTAAGGGSLASDMVSRSQAGRVVDETIDGTDAYA